MPGRRWCVIGYLIIAILLACLCVTSCAVTSGTSDTEAETRFQQLFGPTLSNSLVLSPDKHTYHRDETIIFWVDNRTGQTVWFHDQSFAVQAYTYDKEAEKWAAVDLGFVESNPAPMAVEPGVADFPGIVSVDQIDAPTDGKIRLVITAHADLDNPERDRTYTAYADIAVLE